MIHYYFFPDYRGGNPYQKLLYQNTSRDYKLMINPGDIDTAIASLEKGNRTVFHQHWINIYLKDCLDSRDAMTSVASLVYKLEYFKAKGGVIVWTIHNLTNHEGIFETEDMLIRLNLGACADIIHVHDYTHFDKISHLNIDGSKVVICQHPSYANYYGQFNLAQRREKIFNQETILSALFLGAIRENKNPRNIAKAANELTELGFKVTIAGKPENNEIKKEMLDIQTSSRGTTLILRRLSEADVHQLCCSHNFGIISCDRNLASGTLELYRSYAMAGINCPDLIRSPSNYFLSLSEESSDNQCIIDPNKLYRASQKSYLLSTNMACLSFLSDSVLERITLLFSRKIK